MQTAVGAPLACSCKIIFIRAALPPSTAPQYDLRLRRQPRLCRGLRSFVGDAGKRGLFPAPWAWRPARGRSPRYQDHLHDLLTEPPLSTTRPGTGAACGMVARPEECNQAIPGERQGVYVIAPPSSSLRVCYPPIFCFVSPRPVFEGTTPPSSISINRLYDCVTS
jgi:hypothetical protein